MQRLPLRYFSGRQIARLREKSFKNFRPTPISSANQFLFFGIATHRLRAEQLESAAHLTEQQHSLIEQQSFMESSIPFSTIVV
jgi:hypothetical protein